MSDRTESVTCASHGKGYATYTCHHLVRGSSLGFYQAETLDDPRPDAWCKECELVRMKYGGAWTDESEAFAGITMVCSGCYDVVKRNNDPQFHGGTPNYDEDGWELFNAVEQKEAYPDSFRLPSQEELSTLKPGDCAKLIFGFLAKDESGQEEIQGERMWVLIDGKTDNGFTGRLISQPTSSDVLHPLDRVNFTPQNIIATDPLSFIGRVFTLTSLYVQRLLRRKPKTLFRYVRSSENEQSRPNCDAHEHPQISIHCGICSKVHAALPAAIGYVKPAHYFSIPETEVEKRVKINSDLCQIDDSIFLIRGVIEIPLLDGELEGQSTFEWGMWARIPKASFDRYLELYDNDASREPPFEGFLSGEPRGYKGLLDHPVTIHLRDANARPLFYLKSSKHLMYREQTEGITMKRVHEIFAKCLPHYFH